MPHRECCHCGNTICHPIDFCLHCGSLVPPPRRACIDVGLALGLVVMLALLALALAWLLSQFA